MSRVMRIASHAAVGAAAYTIGHRTAIHDLRDPAREFAEEAARDEERKTALLEHLMHRAYVKLAPSNISGVGAFALVDIPAGVDPFEAPNSELSGGAERSIQCQG